MSNGDDEKAIESLTKTIRNPHDRRQAARILRDNTRARRMLVQAIGVLVVAAVAAYFGAYFMVQ